MVEYLAADPHREYRLTERSGLVNLDAATRLSGCSSSSPGLGWLVKELRRARPHRPGPRLIVCASAPRHRRVVSQIVAYARPEMMRLSADHQCASPACSCRAWKTLVIADLTCLTKTCVAPRRRPW